MAEMQGVTGVGEWEGSRYSCGVRNNDEYVNNSDDSDRLVRRDYEPHNDDRDDAKLLDGGLCTFR